MHHHAPLAALAALVLALAACASPGIEPEDIEPAAPAAPPAEPSDPLPTSDPLPAAPLPPDEPDPTPCASCPRAFTYAGNGTETSVEVRLDVLGWDTPVMMTHEGGNTWVGTAAIPSDVAALYAFVINGNVWIPDPSNPDVDPGGPAGWVSKLPAGSCSCAPAPEPEPEPEPCAGECIPEAPPGWHGPVTMTGQGSTPEGWTLAALGYQVINNGSCTACQCDYDTADCSWDTSEPVTALRVFDGQTCASHLSNGVFDGPNGERTIVWPYSAPRSAIAPWSGNVVNTWHASGGTVSGGVVGWQVIEPPPALGTCGSGVCRDTAPLDGAPVCFWTEGEAQCPGSNPTRRVLRSQITDTRECEPCDCGPRYCPPHTANLYSDAGCSVQVATADFGTCGGAPDVRCLRTQPRPMPPTPSAMLGSVTPGGDTFTVCCGS